MIGLNIVVEELSKLAEAETGENVVSEIVIVGSNVLSSFLCLL